MPGLDFCNKQHVVRTRLCFGRHANVMCAIATPKQLIVHISCVGCSKCRKWFHIKCVGITKKQSEEDFQSRTKWFRNIMFDTSTTEIFRITIGRSLRTSKESVLAPTSMCCLSKKLLYRKLKKENKNAS